MAGAGSAAAAAAAAAHMRTCGCCVFGRMSAWLYVCLQQQLVSLDWGRVAAVGLALAQAVSAVHARIKPIAASGACFAAARWAILQSPAYARRGS